MKTEQDWYAEYKQLTIDDLRRRAQDPPDDSDARRALLAELQRRLVLRQTAPQAQHSGPQQVMVVDVEMRFASMVLFMLKWSIAAIPAMFILALVGGFVLLILGGLGAAIRP